MENTNKRKVRRGEIYYYDFGEKEGSIQSGVRPVLIVQCDEGNRASSTTIVAAITKVIKKQYMPSHIIIGKNYGLRYPSMVLLEQISTVNQADLQRYIGYVDDANVIRMINNGLKKVFGLWVNNPQPKNEIRCLCEKCLKDYMASSKYLIRRANPFERIKERCYKCDGFGYEYLIRERTPMSSLAEVTRNE